MTTTDVPPKYRPLYRRAMTGKSRKAAIRAHCLMCVGWFESEARSCTARNCPLYPYLTRGVKPRRSTIPAGWGQGEGAIT